MILVLIQITDQTKCCIAQMIIWKWQVRRISVPVEEFHILAPGFFCVHYIWIIRIEISCSKITDRLSCCGANCYNSPFKKAIYSLQFVSLPTLYTLQVWILKNLLNLAITDFRNYSIFHCQWLFKNNVFVCVFACQVKS